MRSSLAPLVPAFALSAYFVIGLLVFTLRAWRHGVSADPEVAGRPASMLLGRFLRHFMMWMLAPCERWLVRVGVAPNSITLASFGVALGSAMALAHGQFVLGGWLYLVTGIFDILDGRVARRARRVTSAGAFFDSVMDRYSELVVFGGFAVFYRNSWALLVVLLALIGSIMVSYTRARGESLGVEVNIGTMQRPERLFYLGLITALAPLPEALFGHEPFPPYAAAVIALLMLGVSANLTAVRRILHTLKMLDARAAAEAVVGLGPDGAKQSTGKLVSFSPARGRG